ncbi:MAG: Uncharacterised protein [Crocinitomicaceae bacterium]|nr:MAG: Uncharacterised protein [Crocinitomicaceae bacterium]
MEKTVEKGPVGLVPIPKFKVPISAPYACIQNESSASSAAVPKSIIGETILPDVGLVPLVS